MAKRRPTKADLEARREMIRNAERTRQLAQKAQAELDRRKQHQERDSVALRAGAVIGCLLVALLGFWAVIGVVAGLSTTVPSIVLGALSVGLALAYIRAVARQRFR